MASGLFLAVGGAGILFGRGEARSESEASAPGVKPSAASTTTNTTASETASARPKASSKAQADEANVAPPGAAGADTDEPGAPVPSEGAERPGSEAPQEVARNGPERSVSSPVRRRSTRLDSSTAAPAPRRAAGRVTIDSRPGWANISIGGTSLGPTPIYRHSLQPGSYVVEAELPTGRRQQKSIEVAPGAEVKLVLEW